MAFIYLLLFIYLRLFIYYLRHLSQAGLDLSVPPTSTSQILRFLVEATVPSSDQWSFIEEFISIT